MKELVMILLLPLGIMAACTSTSPEQDQSGDNLHGKRSEIVREYLSPVKILWQSDNESVSILNSGKLLEPGIGQAILGGKNHCILAGNPENPPSILLDFGKELHGGLEIVTGQFQGKEPIRVRISLGESVSEAMSSTGEGSTSTNDHAVRDFELSLPWLGKTEIGNSGFRFARIDLLDTDRTLLLQEIRAIAIYRDIPYLGSFESNDKRLNKIWETGAYTVHLNMQDYLWDGIKRDRLVWVGDMHPEVMTILSVFGYNEVVPKSLDLISEITELPAWMNGLPGYSLWWILIQHQWYMNNGDLEYLEQHQQYIFDLLEVLRSKIDEEGKENLDGTRFLDWPTSPNKEAIHAGLQSMMVMTFKAGAEIAEILGKPDLARECMSTVELLKKHIPGPNGNKSGGAMLVMAGLEDAEKMNRDLLAVDQYKGVSTFYGYYVLQARAMAGDYQGALDVIRKYWGGMLDLGATTFWEDFDLSWAENAARIDELTPGGKIDVHADYGDYCYVGLRHSYCHGWASGPTAWMSQHVLGINVMEPGCKAIKITPHLGDLEWVEGSYPTPLGVIKVRHEKQADGSIDSKLDIPKGIKLIK